MSKETHATWRELGKEVGIWLAWAGVALGVLAAVSALTRMLSIGLRAFLHDVIQIYRKALSPIYDLVALLPIHVPMWLVDALVLYLVLLAMSVRSIFITSAPLRELMGGGKILSNDPIGRMYKSADPALGSSRPVIVLKSALLLPVVTAQPIRHYFAVRRWVRGADDTVLRVPARRSALMFVALPVAVLVFLTVNAYLPI